MPIEFNIILSDLIYIFMSNGKSLLSVTFSNTFTGICLFIARGMFIYSLHINLLFDAVSKEIRYTDVYDISSNKT